MASPVAVDGLGKYQVITFGLLFLTVVLATPSQWQKQACLSRNSESDNRFTCSKDGRIKCLEGWQGDLCQVPMCGNDCDPQHGYCSEPGKCKCNLGYYGNDCRSCVRLPGCKHGDCRKSFECRCHKGYSGMFCNKVKCSAGCDSRTGHCEVPGECRCRAGYSGRNCTECATRAGCKYGVCDKPNECKCLDGWTGPLCDQAVCAAGCHKENGYCASAGECRCKVGWRGPACDTCVGYPSCANGDCLSPWECNCQPGWTGFLCDQPEVELFGEGEREGRCLPLGSFVCMNGGKDVCRYLGNGTQIGGSKCICADDFTGDLCQRSAAASILHDPKEAKETHVSKLGIPNEATKETHNQNLVNVIETRAPGEDTVLLVQQPTENSSSEEEETTIAGTPSTGFMNVTTDPKNIVNVNTEENNWSKKLSSQKQDHFVPIIQ